MRVLIVDNNVMQDSWGAAELRESVRASSAGVSGGVEIHTRRGPADDLPSDLARYDRIVVSGSLTSAFDEAPWIARLDGLIREAIDRGKPLLGVCYGHQALARVLGGRSVLGRSERPEIGWTRIDILDDGGLLRGLGKTFYTFSSHLEEVSRLPAGLKRLASSERCGIQAFALEGKPVFGIQFHPEKDLSSALKTFAERIKKGQRKLLLHPEGSRKYFDPKVGETIFKNFMSTGR